MPLPIKKGFFRYKCCVRDIRTKEIVGYLEGNRRFNDLFNGETFYLNGQKVYCIFTNQNGEEERLFASEIDTSEYDLLWLSKNLTVIRTVGKPNPPSKVEEKSPKKTKPRPSVSINYEKGNKMWKVRTREDGKRKHLGCFIADKEALEFKETYETTYYNQR